MSLSSIQNMVDLINFMSDTIGRVNLVMSPALPSPIDGKAEFVDSNSQHFSSPNHILIKRVTDHTAQSLYKASRSGLISQAMFLASLTSSLRGLVRNMIKNPADLSLRSVVSDAFKEADMEEVALLILEGWIP